MAQYSQSARVSHAGCARRAEVAVPGNRWSETGGVFSIDAARGGRISGQEYQALMSKAPGRGSGRIGAGLLRGDFAKLKLAIIRLGLKRRRISNSASDRKSLKKTLDKVPERGILFARRTICQASMRKINTTNFSIATRTTARDINRRIALNIIRERQPISRADLASSHEDDTRVVSVLVQELILQDLIYEGATGEAARDASPRFYT